MRGSRWGRGIQPPPPPPPKRKKLSINFPKILERIQKGIENTQKKINTKEEMHILKEKTGKQYKGYLITSFYVKI